MRIGVISDTHGMLERTRRAVEVFDREGIDTVLHCGDVGGLPIFEQFVGKRLWFVWGNTDRPDPSWREALATWGVAWPQASPLHVPLDEKRVVVIHGHEAVFPLIIRDPGVDYLFHGHSHERLCARVKGCTVVNPGAIQRSALPTVAIVDLQAAAVRYLDLHGKAVAGGC